MKSRKAASVAKSPEILGFLGGAAKDYIGARVLLNARLPVQGAILASTAIEKYFKTVMAFRGNSSCGHLKKAHWNSVKNFIPGIFADLNPNFLRLLQRCYEMRYPDTLRFGFNLVIASREFLAELDHTALSIHYGFGLKRDEEYVGTEIETYRKEKDERLLANNHVLSGEPKQSFIEAATQLVYEIRVDPIRGLVEAYYTAKPSRSNGAFLREGLRPGDKSGMSFDLAFKVLQKQSAT